MFVVSTSEQSEHLLAELCRIEEEIFTELGLHYRMLVMPLALLAVLTLIKSDRLPLYRVWSRFECFACL